MDGKLNFVLRKNRDYHYWGDFKGLVTDWDIQYHSNLSNNYSPLCLSTLLRHQ